MQIEKRNALVVTIDGNRFIFGRISAQAMLDANVYAERYTSNEAGDYSKTFVRCNPSLTYDEVPMFEGSLTELREMQKDPPKNAADLVADMSAMEASHAAEIAQLRATINELRSQLGFVPADT